jgi:hypothetical protein
VPLRGSAQKKISKTNMKNKKLNISLDKALTNFTLAKFCGAMTAIIILATVKYLITGDFHIEFSDY